MITRKLTTRLADSFLPDLLITLTAATALFDDIDYGISDKFYQQQGKKSLDIVVIGIDQITLNNLGSKPSIRRRDMARAITLFRTHATLLSV